MKNNLIRKKLVKIKIFEDLKKELGRRPYSWEVKQRAKEEYPEVVSVLDSAIASFERVLKSNKAAQI